MLYSGLYPVLPLPVVIYLRYLPLSIKNGIVQLSCIFEPTVPITDKKRNANSYFSVKFYFICNLINKIITAVVPTKSDSDVLFCLQLFSKTLTIDRSLVY